MIFIMVMKYLTLEGRHKVFYYCHLPLLNHFCNNDLLCLPFYLLHSIESLIKDTMEPKHVDKPPYLLHHGLIYRLYKFHEALPPPKTLALSAPYAYSSAACRFVYGLPHIFSIRMKALLRPTSPCLCLLIPPLFLYLWSLPP